MENRFPRPDFVSGYAPPHYAPPAPADAWLAWLDVALLFAALTLATLLILRWRSRRGVVALTVAALLYFGFLRHGCICPVGAVQNVCETLSDSAYALPAAVVFIFLAPLLFALFFGRVFCAAVCPLGAIQELVVVKPKALPFWLNRLLGMGRYLVLGLGVFAVVTGLGFLICRYDPFVGLFRMGGTPLVLAIGLGVLAVGMFIGRPFCRFICPYAVFLEWFSRLSWRRASITPAECINCRLCETSCPYDAIEKPEREAKHPERERKTALRRVAAMLVLAPVLTLGGALGGAYVGPLLGRGHPTLELANAVEGNLPDASLAIRDRVEAYQAAGIPRDALLADARDTYARLTRAGRWLGAYAGFVLALHLVALSRRITHDDYRPDPAACLGCARCYRYCPVPKPE